MRADKVVPKDMKPIARKIELSRLIDDYEE
jgi:hypothetical protein